MFLAIDPGNDTGWALFDDARRLIACGLGDPRTCSKHRASAITDVLIESPVIYRRSPVNPNDIITLARNAGEWGGIYNMLGCTVAYTKPFNWKGAVTKTIHHARLWEKLDESEKTLLELAFTHGQSDATVSKKLPASKRHNVLDAVGIGLYGVGR